LPLHADRKRLVMKIKDFEFEYVQSAILIGEDDFCSTQGTAAPTTELSCDLVEERDFARRRELLSEVGRLHYVPAWCLLVKVIAAMMRMSAYNSHQSIPTSAFFNEPPTVLVQVLP
jgi:hypothetical protein